MSENEVKSKENQFKQETNKNDVKVKDSSNQNVDVPNKINVTHSEHENQNNKLAQQKNDKKEENKNDQDNKRKKNNNKKKNRFRGDYSDGEGSVDFETVSSVDSQIDLDELGLSSDSEDLNGFLRVENDLATHNLSQKRDRGGYYHSDYGDKDSSKLNSRNRSIHYSSRSSPNRYRSRRSEERSKEYRSWGRRSDEERWRYSRRDRWSNENDDLEYSKFRRSRDREFRRNSDSNYRRTKGPRSSDRRSRSRSPLYYRGRRDDRDCGISDWADPLKSASSKKIYTRNDNSYSSNSIRLRDFPDLSPSSCSDDSKTSFNSPSRRRRRSPSPSSSRSRSHSREVNNSLNTSVRSRLENKVSRFRKSDEIDSKSERFLQKRKKERTPFLEELEKKLKVAELVKSTINKISEMNRELNISSTSITSTTVVPETAPVPVPHVPSTMNYGSMPYSFGMSMEHYNANITYPSHYSSFPTVSLDNLPLVPGPTGLPVHITLTGEQIPYDIDGRRIPVGPNGHYLPLDPSGRLFPHIVSPQNTAVPIHISDDGVLRLPNLRPVPYGPPHQLPVNIDGSYIVIGPDSKPLYPCPNLPTRPPPELSLVPPNGQSYHKTQMIRQDTQTQTIRRRWGQPQQPKKKGATKSNVKKSEVTRPEIEILTPSEVENKNKKKDVEKDVEVLTSKTAVDSRNTSIPSEGHCSSSSDMVLSTGDSESQIKVFAEVGSDEESSLQIVYDNNISSILENIMVDDLSTGNSWFPKPKRVSNGRFVFSIFLPMPLLPLPNESPLKKRRKLPFITKNSSENKESAEEKSTPEEDVLVVFRSENTSDASVQCDFTSEIMFSLAKKVKELTNEVALLKKEMAML